MIAARLIPVALLAASAATAAAQGTDYRTFSVYIENDAFVNSDTAYTNGVRLTWTLARNGRWTRGLANAGLPWLLRVATLDRALGTDLERVSAQPCQPGDVRRDRASGRCLLLELGLGQTIYTPDSLTDTNLELRDRPYAGFLFVSAGGTSFDAPRSRDTSAFFSMVQISNAVILGVTGPAAFSKETQALAHWTWATGAARPLGWHNQLRGGPQAAFVTEIYARPHFSELCNLRVRGKRRCNGSVDERRWLDFTPRTEVVAGTYMARASAGAVLRVGRRFPDAVNVARIPTTAPATGPTLASMERRIVPERHWWYVFLAGDGRWVPYNSFIEGGYADRGDDRWRGMRQIDARRGISEGALGFALGNSRMTAQAQFVVRTPEYDVRGADRARGLHRYASISLAMHTRPGAH